MSLPSAEVAADFRDALQDLKLNSRPEISNLTIIAKENTEHAQAISLELENHIRSTRPEWKLPSLYVLDSIVKNVGTPYTVYIGRNLYRTFMDAYLAIDGGTRKAMEGLLRTWKQPVPESMDPRPVFPPEVTGDLENALTKMRNAAARQVHALPPRPAVSAAWTATPTPPQAHSRFAPPKGVPGQDPRARMGYPQAPQYGQYSAPAPTLDTYSSTRQTPEPMSSNDLEDLKAEVGRLISSSQQAFAYNPADTALQVKLSALMQLRTVLNTQTLPPQQLEQVRSQVRNLAPNSVPVSAPVHPFLPQAPISAHLPSTPQQPMNFSSPPPAPSNPPINLAQILASVKPQGTPSNPNPVPSTPNLADLLRGVLPSAQTPTLPSATPFQLPLTTLPTNFTPVHAPAYPPPPIQSASTPTPAPPATPNTNLAALLAQFSKPPATPALPQPHPPPISQAPIVSKVPTIGSAEWLVNALKGVTPHQPVNIATQALGHEAKQSNDFTSSFGDVELSTASFKKPRLHLISRLYNAYPNQCVTCGRRFEATSEGKEKKARHMDWHFKVKDPDAIKRGIHRSWYISEKEWVEYREVDETSPAQPANGVGGAAASTKKQAKDKYVPVPQDPLLAHAPCPICQERFDTQWLVEANDFVWMDALQVGGKIYHATCWEEYSKGASIALPSTPDSVLGKRKAEAGTPASGKKVRAY